MSKTRYVANGTSLYTPATLSELEEEYRKNALNVRGVCLETVKSERPYLKRFFEYFGPPDCPSALFAAINPVRISDCLIQYASNYGRGSQRCMQKTVRLFLRFAFCSGYLKQDFHTLAPSVRTPRMGRVIQAITPESANAVISSLGRETPEELRDAAILMLLNTYGVRGVQVRRLHLQDIDWPRRRIFFSSVKGGRPIDQYLTTEVGNRLSDYILNGRPVSSFSEVFLRTGPPIEPIVHPRQLSRIIRKRIVQAGIKLPKGTRYGSHTFRHAFASRLYGKVPFMDIVDMLGHRDPTTTLVYGKISLADLQKAALPWPGGVE